MKRGTLALSWGPWGGFYVTRSRICLGFVAITLLRENEIDELMEGYCDYLDLREDLEALKAEFEERARSGHDLGVTWRREWERTRRELDARNHLVGVIQHGDFSEAAVRVREAIDKAEGKS